MELSVIEPQQCALIIAHYNLHYPFSYLALKTLGRSSREMVGEPKWGNSHAEQFLVVRDSKVVHGKVVHDKWVSVVGR